MRDVRSYRPFVKQVAELEDEVKKLSDEDFPKETARLRDELKNGGNIKKILPYCFALVREASVRTLGLRHFDVQIMGGAVLFEGKIAEMATGEGKTLVATLPVYAKAVAGIKTHIVTVNDYLARRDACWMGPVYRFLGLSVGFIQHDSSVEERQKAYSCDVNFITNNELGFDYLRDNMVVSLKEKVMKKREYAIIDEVDSILIDEARTPLIISGAGEEATEKYSIADRVASRLKVRFVTEAEEVEAKYQEIDLKKGYDAIVDEKSHSVELTDTGIKKCEAFLGVQNMYDDIQSSWPHHITQSIRARHLFKRDSHYVVQDGEVVIVDEFTGRMMPGRRWSDGLHQAVEAKENISVRQESQTLATITFQNFFNLYDDKAGMTGTAVTEAPEFKKIYKLDVVCIPTNQPIARKKNDDQIYKTEKEKFDALIDEVKRINASGAPVLIGTRSIETNERIGALLKRAGITHELLNARYHAREADIIAQAGRLKAVTVATNMAGRGTDIMLGGNPEFLAKIHPGEDATGHEELLVRYRAQCAAEKEKVVEASGLFILGTERHESRRIDNQLRGRSGRQGDPGASRFYLSLEDDLLRIFGSDRISGLMKRLGMEEGQPIEAGMVTRAIENAQKKVEARNFEIRKHLLEYDDVLNQQRKVIYAQRRKILEGEGISDDVDAMVEEVVERLLDEHLPADYASRAWDPKPLATALIAAVGRVHLDDLTPLLKMAHAQRKEALLAPLKAELDGKRKLIGPENAAHLQKMVMLQYLDGFWKDHLLIMDHLKEGIGLRGYGQRNPLIEYKKEGFKLFEAMTDRIKDEVVRTLFHLQIRIQPPPAPQAAPVADHPAAATGTTDGTPIIPPPLPAPRPPSRLQYSHGDGNEVPNREPIRNPIKVGRNDLCPCGSGKKYKKCHGAQPVAGR